MHTNNVLQCHAQGPTSTLYLAPGITAELRDDLPQHVIDNRLVLFYKLWLLCDMAEQSLPSDPKNFYRLPVQQQVFLRFIHLAPVLSTIAALDVIRVDHGIVLEVINVPLLGTSWKYTNLTNFQLVCYSTLMSWTV